MSNNSMQRINMIKKYLISLSLTITALMGQSSIVIPAGASITVPDNAYVCAGTITVNGDLISSGTNVCGVTDAGAVASILEASSLNEDGYYKIGDQISVTLSFTRKVIVTGTPQLSLETGSTDQVASYSSGSESVTLTFNYIVQEGDVSPDLEYVSTSALSLNGGSIKDVLDRDSEISLPEPGAAKSLSANKDLYVDGIIPSIGDVRDGGSEDLQYTSSLTELDLNWTSFDDKSSSGIKRYFAGLGSTPGGVEIEPFVDVGNFNQYRFKNLTLTNGSTYYGVVKAEDQAGNISLVSVTDGVTVDEFAGPPSISTINPDVTNTLSLSLVSTLNISFSEPIASISLDVTSTFSTVNYSYELNSNDLVITILPSLASRDEVVLEISDIKDFAGIKAADQTFTYSTATLADLNQDSNVNAGDLSLFVTAWNTDDFTKELGPSTGTVPNLIIAPDNQYDLEDVMGFSRMWHWSRKNGVSGKLLSHYGKEISTSQIGSTLLIDWDKEASVAQFEFIYEPQFVSINEYDQNNTEDMELSYMDTLRGVNTFAYANLSKNKYIDKRFVTKVKGRDSKPIDLIYQFYSHDGELISQGTKSIMIKPIPDKFVLHQNYPNPFNPITTINYDLPNRSIVNLVIYDIMGRKVATLLNEEKNEGYHSIIWNTRNNVGTPVSAGIYFYRIQTKDFAKVRKMILLK